MKAKVITVMSEDGFWKHHGCYILCREATENIFPMPNQISADVLIVEGKNKWFGAKSFRRVLSPSGGGGNYVALENGVKKDIYHELALILDSIPVNIGEWFTVKVLG